MSQTPIGSREQSRSVCLRRAIRSGCLEYGLSATQQPMPAVRPASWPRCAQARDDLYLGVESIDRAPLFERERVRGDDVRRVRGERADDCRKAPHAAGVFDDQLTSRQPARSLAPRTWPGPSGRYRLGRVAPSSLTQTSPSRSPVSRSSGSAGSCQWRPARQPINWSFRPPPPATHNISAVAPFCFPNVGGLTAPRSWT